MLVDLPQFCVNIDPRYVGPFARPMRDLYGALSAIPLPESVSAPAGLLPLLEQVYRGGEFEHQVTPDVALGRPADRDTGAVLVGYSGGKDSMAAVIACQGLGLHPIMFHVAGINRSYPNETTTVAEAAARLGAPLVVPHVRHAGQTAYPDSPVKDQLILAMMVDYGYATGCSRFTMGVQSSTTLVHSNILYNWSDNWEMFEAVRPWFKTAWPAYSWRWVLESKTHSYKIIADRDPSLFDAVCSCVLPYRYQAARRRGNEKKFGVSLLPNRCGSCQKCAVEYLNFVALGIAPHCAGFVEHSIEILRRKQSELFGPGYSVGDDRAAVVGIAIDSKWANPAVLL